jgi:elongation factor G
MPKKIRHLLEAAIEPKTAADAERLVAALESLAKDDPAFGISTDPESGQTILHGVSETQLEEKLRLLEGISFNVGAPQAAYLETLSKPVTVKYTHKKQAGGSGQFAEVTINFEPLPPGSGFVFENEVVDGSVPKEFIPAVEKGLKTQKESGLMAGFPVIDFKATLTDGKYHEVDSNALTFDIAARAAFRELASRGAVKLLEPIMKVEVVMPEDFLGGVIGDINARRGQVQGTVNGEIYSIVTALVPVSNTFGLGNTLQAMCRGRAIYEMVFDHYEPVPQPDEPDPTFPGAMGMRVA